MLTEVGFVDIEIGPPVDTFAGAAGEANARTFEVFGYAFLARKPQTVIKERRPGSGGRDA
jgi:hypothetical protein